MQLLPTENTDAIHLYVWSGEAESARALVDQHYPGVEISEFPHRKLRESSILGRLRLLRAFRGHVIVFYFHSLAALQYRQMLGCMHLLHRCDETVLCDSGNQWESIRSVKVLRSIPGIVFRILLDCKTLVFWRLYLQVRSIHSEPAASALGNNGLGIAYLLPSPQAVGSSGGAISHIRGVLSGLQSIGETCRVFSGTPVEQDSFKNVLVTAPNRPYFFWESDLLAYNDVFVKQVQQQLLNDRPRFLYQRHSRFSIAGALLSSRLKIPLILEYNGPQRWIADHWDPTLFRGLVGLCEDVSLRSAARIIVVSDALKAELLDRGIPEDRIRVNPNGVDPNYFYPGCGKGRGRAELAAKPDEVLIGFVGSFSLWHGIEVLQQAIVTLLSNPRPCRLRFVLMGGGLLQGEMRTALTEYERAGDVIFTGLLPPGKVADFLDAADILVSPHIPNPDGTRFFGSPTKLFEYMAMGKAIVGSRLEQIAEVLEHDRTAWLVTPGDVNELAEAIRFLASNPLKRKELGAAARQCAVEFHSWARNVAWALSDLPSRTKQSGAFLEAPKSSALTQ
jgi:glycosyltransferase involved in cell wall biosynthesis